MSKPIDDLSILFRSIGPDDANFQATTKAAAREAEQRWPLFKAISPKKPDVAPALSAPERQHWTSQEKPAVGARKPVLSLPGLSDKLAKSLTKMSGRVASAETVAEQVARTDPEKPPNESSRNIRKFSEATPSDHRGSLFSKLPAAAPNVETNSHRPGLFENIAADQVVAECDMPVAARAADSLASVFSRLEGKKEISTKPVVNRSSFLGRLGKR